MGGDAVMLTEEEAKKKWCPFVRHEGDKGGSWNRTVSAMKRIFGWDGGNPYPEETCNCIASECMAWRFKPHEWKHKAHGGDWIDTQETDGYGRKGEKLPTVGYCGLAGSP